MRAHIREIRLFVDRLIAERKQVSHGWYIGPDQSNFYLLQSRGLCLQMDQEALAKKPDLLSRFITDARNKGLEMS